MGIFEDIRKFTQEGAGVTLPKPKPTVAPGIQPTDVFTQIRSLTGQVIPKKPITISPTITKFKEFHAGEKEGPSPFRKAFPILETERAEPEIRKPTIAQNVEGVLRRFPPLKPIFRSADTFKDSLVQATEIREMAETAKIRKLISKKEADKIQSTAMTESAIQTLFFVPTTVFDAALSLPGISKAKPGVEKAFEFVGTKGPEKILKPVFDLIKPHIPEEHRGTAEGIFEGAAPTVSIVATMYALGKLGVKAKSQVKTRLANLLDAAKKDPVTIPEAVKTEFPNLSLEQQRQMSTMAVQVGEQRVARLRGPEDALPRTPEKIASDLGRRVEKITKEADVAEILKKTAEDFKPQITEQRRKSITIEKTKALAQQLNVSERQLTKGKALNAEELIAMESVLRSATEKVRDISEKITKGDDSTGTKLLFQEAVHRQIALQKNFSGGRAEAGRALRVLREIADVKTAKEAARERLIKQLGGKEKDLAKALESLDKVTDGDIAAINKLLADSQKATFWDKISYFWVNSILSSPLTQEVNILSTAAKTGFEIPLRLVEATLESPKALVGKKREVIFSEIPPLAFGMLQGILRGVPRAMQVLKEGVPETTLTKFDVPRQAIKGKAGAVIGAPTRFLIVFDEFFKTVNRTANMAAEAHRIAKQEGLKGQKFNERVAELKINPSEKTLGKVEDITLENVFQTPLEEGGAMAQVALKIASLRNLKPPISANRMKNLLNQTTFGVSNLAATFIAAFIRTPFNLFKEGFKLTPLNVLGTIPKAVAKQPIRRDLAKLTIGSMIATWFALKYLQGEVTGNVPKDPKERAAFYAEGKQAQAIKIDNNWWSYRRVDPFATAIGLVVDTVDEVARGNDEGVVELSGKAVGIFTRNLKDKTYVQGVSNLMEAMDNPDRRGTKLIAGIAAGFVPKIIGDISEIMDPVIREKRGVLESIQAEIPFLRERLEPKIDIRGEEVEREGGVFNRVFNPLQGTADQRDPAIDEMFRLGTFPSVLKNSFTVKGVPIEMEPKQFTEYQKTVQGLRHKAVLLLVKAPEYKTMIFEEQQKELEKIFTKAKELGKIEMLKNMGKEKIIEFLKTEVEKRQQERRILEQQPR